jgi:hypothetical protein
MGINIESDSEAAPQVAANGLDDLFMLIEEIGDRRERWFQNYSLPQQLPVGEAELRIGGSRHRSTLRLFRRHLPLALQSLHVPRCGLVQQFLKGAPVVQTAPNFRHQFFWNVNRKPASLATTVQDVTRVLFTRSASLAILPYARAPTQAQRAQNGRPSARRPIRQPARYIRR